MYYKTNEEENQTYLYQVVCEGQHSDVRSEIHTFKTLSGEKVTRLVIFRSLIHLNLTLCEKFPIHSYYFIMSRYVLSLFAPKTLNYLAFQSFTLSIT